MKKIFLAIILILALAVPVVADSPILVYVNGKQVGEGVLIGDRTYVPIRAVSEALGAKVDWDGSVRISDLKRPEINTPEIKQIINDALDLLEEQDTASSNLSCQNVDARGVTEGTEKIFENRLAIGGYGFISFTTDFVKDKKRFVPQYVAGVLSHEAVHCAQVLGSNIERKEYEAYAHQRVTLELISAPQWMINEASYQR